MELADWVTRALTAPDGKSLAARARRRRWDAVTARFPGLADMTVLDLGGLPSFWIGAPIQPASVVVLNLEERANQPEAAWITRVAGDACDLPAALRGRTFDLVFSNSVVEHIIGNDQRRRFVDTVETASDQWWVQTPYRYFPIEPHWLFPGFQFLPLWARARVSMHWRVGHMRTANLTDATGAAQSVDLLTITELRGLFPTSHVWRERAGGMVKSITAVRSIA